MNQQRQCPKDAACLEYAIRCGEECRCIRSCVQLEICDECRLREGGRYDVRSVSVTETTDRHEEDHVD